MFPLQTMKVMLCDMVVRLTIPNQCTAAPDVGSCPSAPPPRPCATRDIRSVAGLCFEAKSGVTFRPTLGQRCSLESCRRIAEAAEWSVGPPASFTARARVSRSWNGSYRTSATAAVRV